MSTENKPEPKGLGAIIRNVVSLRAEPNGKAEQISQALLGQSILVQSKQDEWLRVKTWDSYEGWLLADAVRMLGSASIPYASSGTVARIRKLFVDIHSKPDDVSDILTKATIGVELEVIEIGEWLEIRLPNERMGYIPRDSADLLDKDHPQPVSPPEPAAIIATAKRFIGVPYLWGGTSPFGIDCSGFIQLVHRMHGVSLPRDAYMQAGDARCIPIEKSEILAGDLLFFGKGQNIRDITHVGLALDESAFIHSRGDEGVIITPLDFPRYVELYWGARRLNLTD